MFMFLMIFELMVEMPFSFHISVALCFLSSIFFIKLILLFCSAYSLEEVEHKTASLRDSANYTVGDDASAFEV